MSVYNYAENEPVGHIDLWGLQKISVNKRISEAAFFITHPIAALKIGKDKEGSFRSNTSTYAANFAINLTKNTTLSTDAEGSDRNAIRHALWQALIARDFGVSIANDAGMAHEGLIMPTVFVNKDAEFISPSLNDADIWADFMNNEIGQNIGKRNPKASNKELANKVIEEFKTNGLWIVKESNEGYLIKKSKTTPENHSTILENVKPLNNNGLKKQKHQRGSW